MERKSVLRHLGIYGYEGVEDLILAGLVTGDPVLLVGSHGTAKTMLCKRLADALGLRFIAYDASKALFEDVIGFPDPYSIKKGRIKYVSTPISIADKEFVLIDEISRANYQMQSKWLELIRSRQIMGEKIKGIKYIFSAMNPPSYPGARTLDPALAGRFTFIIWVPEFGMLSEEDKFNVLSNITEDDAVLLHDHLNLKTSSSYSPLKKLIEKAKQIYPSMNNKIGKKAGEFVVALHSVLKEESEECEIDGRRSGMIKRGIVAVCSVLEAKGEFSEENLPEIFLSITPFLLPYSVLDETFSNEWFEFPLIKTIERVFTGTGEKDRWLPEHTTLTRLEARIEQESHTERKFSLLEQFYKMKLPSSHEIKRRFMDFHKKVFLSSKREKELDLLIDNKRNGTITLSPDELLAIRLTGYFCGEDASYYRDVRRTFAKLMEIINKKKGGKNEGSKNSI